MEKIHFEWKEEYSVHVKIMDAQHKRLFEVIDVLYQYILNKGTKDELADIFKRLNEYANTHFLTEEKYFKDFGYQEADIHTALHQKFKDDLAETEARAVDENFNTLELLIFLENWWINHILDVDKKYSEFFNEHGLL